MTKFLWEVVEFPCFPAEKLKPGDRVLFFDVDKFDRDKG